MSTAQFILNQPVSVEETRHYEFKEIKGANPVDTIKNTVDEYVVAFLNSEGGRIYWGIRNADKVVVGVQLNNGQRDTLRRVVGEKLSQIQPAIAPTAYRIDFHQVYEATGLEVSERFVVEVIAPRVLTTDLYFTGGNEAFVKTDGGKKKLSGPELQDEILRRRQGQASLDGAAERSAAKTTLAKGRLNELLAVYETQLESKVSRVKIFGNTASYPLEKVFVELMINEDYNQRADESQHLGLLDVELRRLRSIFGDGDEDGGWRYSDPAYTNSGKNKIKPDELLCHPTHAIITGAPGCGKTTLMRYLSWRTLKQWRNTSSNSGAGTSSEQNGARFPIFLEFKQLNATAFALAQGQLEDLLFDKAIANTVKPQNEIERAALKHHFRDLLRAGRVAIFLDGLDEVSGANFFIELQAAVSAFLQSAYGSNLILISTRPFAIRQFGDAQIMEIAPFSLKQIKLFIEHYYGTTPESQLFQYEVRRWRELRELARIPALLGLTLQMWLTHGSVNTKKLTVNTKKLTLYDVVSREQSQQLDSDKEGIQPDRKWLVADPDGSLKRDFMRQLAFDLLFKGIVNLDQKVTSDLERLVFTSDTILKTARRFADRIKQSEDISINPRHLADDAKATAIFRQVGTDKYAFTHLTLQEYLAASELAENEDCEQVFCRAFFNPTLVAIEVLPMALGLTNYPDKLYQALGHLPESINFLGMHLLARGLDYGAEISDASLQEISNRLVEFVCTSNIDIHISELVRSFAWLRERPSFCEGIISLLNHKDGMIRSRAAALLGKVRNEQAVPALLKALNDEEELVRGEAALALGNVGEGRAVEAALFRSLKKDPKNRFNYKRALYQLGWFTEQQYERFFLEPLIQLVRISGLDKDVKDRIIKDILAEGRTDFMREQIDEYCRKQELAACREKLHAQCEIIEESQKKGEVPVVSRMINLLQRCRDTEARARATALLQQIGDERAINLLHRELEVGDKVVDRKQAVIALMWMGREQSVSHLLKALNDASISVRWKAVTAIGQLKPEVIASGLLQAMSHEDNFVRKKAAETVGYYKTSGVKEELIRLATDDPSPEVQKTAQETLQKFERKLYYFNILTPATPA